jgi:hypothetical protein
VSTDSNGIGIGRPGAESLLRGASEIAKLIESAANTARPVDVAIAAQNQAMLGTVATAHALLAVEARLGQLVEQQRIANALTGLGTARAGVFGPGEETAPAIDAVRRLLGLDDEQEGRPE